MALPNKYAGEVPVKIGRKDYTLAFTARAFATLRSNFENGEITKVLAETDFDKIAVILECGLKKHHPEMTAAKIMDEIVPLVPAIEAISKAMRYATDGTENTEPAPEENTSPPA